MGRFGTSFKTQAYLCATCCGHGFNQFLINIFRINTPHKALHRTFHQDHRAGGIRQIPGWAYSIFCIFFLLFLTIIKFILYIPCHIVAQYLR